MNRRGEGEVSIEHNGKTYTGHWTAERGGVLRLNCFELGSKVTQIGGMTEEALARLLLRELVTEAEAKQRR